MIWESPDEARTDFFLAGATYVIGPTIIGLLVGLLPSGIQNAILPALALVVPLATTALVPILLARYRKQGIGFFGGGGGIVAIAKGAVLASPLVAGTLVQALVDPRLALVDAFPVGAITGRAGTNALISLLGRLIFWIGFGILMVFATVKARAAFRPQTTTLRTAAYQVARVVALVAGVAFVALLLARQGPLADVSLEGRDTLSAILALVLPAAGIAGCAYLAWRGVAVPVTTDRWTVFAPVILAAAGPFSLTTNAQVLFFLLYVASLYAAFALTVVIIVESRRPAGIVLGMSVTIALLTSLGQLSA